ncbi:MAG: RNA polymerase sigma-70 factor [Streptosporangiaceae bacterium]|jgi:RNA polymerase sigma-70 factor (ECF subfamily)
MGEVEQYRGLMFSIAYRMTGSVSDAEDIVQEAFARVLRLEPEMADPKAYLATTVTRLAINQLTSARARRESYVGAWLPEPVVTEPGPEEHAEMADSLSMAFLIVLESLSPVERAVLLLHDVFGYDHAEIADIVGKSPQACRQVLVRARRHVDEGKPRFESSREQRDEVGRRFFAAAEGGDLDALLAVLAPDVVFHGDGGGKAQAVTGPLLGSVRVARFLTGLFRRGNALGVSIRLTEVNGQPGAIGLDSSGRVIGVFVLDIVDGLVVTVRSVVNPDKLHHLGAVSDVALKPPQDLPWPAWPPISPRRPLPPPSSSRSPRRPTRGCARS